MGMVSPHQKIPVQIHLPIGGFFQGVDATDQGTLTRTGRADNGNLLPLPDVQVDILEGL
jgi:hypothetical protein